MGIKVPKTEAADGYSGQAPKPLAWNRRFKGLSGEALA
jgi:hypothetical protein